MVLNLGVPVTKQEYKTLSEFRPFYVGEHRKRLTRRLHFIGTSCIFIWLSAAIIRREPRLLILSVVTPYFYAWIGHFLVEKNRPATFKYPVKSLLSDFKMYGLMCLGKMDAELEKYKLV
jgi:hypothetical protein